MIEPTDEMVQLALDIFLATPTESIAQIDAGMAKALKAVFAIGERELRKQIADVLDSQARLLRGDPFRSGQVGIEYICGIEDASSYVETGEWL